MTGYECAVCWDELQGQPTVRFKEYCLCPECSTLTAQLFGRAFQDKAYYPPRFGLDLLSITDFVDLLSPGFVDAYRLKEREYATPAHERLYCPHVVGVRSDGGVMMDQMCSTFLSARSKWTGEKVECKACYGTVCTYCRQDNALSSEQELHVCKKVRNADLLEEQTSQKKIRASRDERCAGLELQALDGDIHEQHPHGKVNDITADELSTLGDCHGKDPKAEYLAFQVPVKAAGGEEDTHTFVRHVRESETNVDVGAVFATKDLDWARDSAATLLEARRNIMARYKDLVQARAPVPETLLPTYNIVRRAHTIAYEISRMDEAHSQAQWQSVIAKCSYNADILRAQRLNTDGTMAGQLLLDLESCIDRVLSTFEELWEYASFGKASHPRFLRIHDSSLAAKISRAPDVVEGYLASLA